VLYLEGRSRDPSCVRSTPRSSYLILTTTSLVVNHLSNLFFELAWTELPAVKPEIQLAKLALVTSKDEEEEAKSDKSDATTGTNTTLQSGSTLVDEPTSIATESGDNGAPQVPAGPLPTDSNTTHRPPTAPSVLGKRPAGGSPIAERERRHTTAMDLDNSSQDTAEKDGFVILDKPNGERAPSLPAPQPRRATTIAVETISRSSTVATLGSETQTEDVEMADADASSATLVGGPTSQPTTAAEADASKPPPLPPRKKPATQSDSVMMFGTQILHHVY
jgi:ubiquitin carboxyl-terminal hydrolase 25